MQLSFKTKALAELRCDNGVISEKDKFSTYKDSKFFKMPPLFNYIVFTVNQSVWRKSVSKNRLAMAISTWKGISKLKIYRNKL